MGPAYFSALRRQAHKFIQAPVVLSSEVFGSFDVRASRSPFVFLCEETASLLLLLFCWSRLPVFPGTPVTVGGYEVFCSVLLC